MADKKKVLAIAAVIVLLAGGAWLYANFGSVVTRMAEKIASDALGVKVNIGSIDVSLAGRKVTVNTLEVGNPPGYSKPYAMTAEKILIGLNSASKQLIDFSDIEVKGSVVNFEVNEKGTNLTDLKALANRKEQRQAVGSEQVRVIIQHMVIDASTINPSISLIKRDIHPVKMPPLQFSSIGKGGGVSAGAVIVQVLGRYLSEAESAAQESGMLEGLPGMGGGAGSTIDKATDALKKLF